MRFHRPGVCRDGRTRVGLLIGRRTDTSLRRVGGYRMSECAFGILQRKN